MSLVLLNRVEAGNADHFSQSSVDIIAIPSIGGDPRKCFIIDDQQWLETLYGDIPNARIYLYDHLTEPERNVEKKPQGHVGHQESAEAYVEVEDNLSQLGIEEFAARLLTEVQRVWDDQRSLVFICHSTGGIVLKNVLCRADEQEDHGLLRMTIGVTFFATPHRGSHVLSKDEFTRAVRKIMALKFEMSPRLRSQLTLDNSILEDLNDRFGSKALGVSIWNYVENLESQLKVLTESGGEMLTQVSMRVVDPRSAELRSGSIGSLIEVEEFFLNTTHVGTARLADDDGLYRDYRNALRRLIRSTSAEDRRIHHELINVIKNDVKVDVHQFYSVDNIPDTSTSTVVWSETTSLHDFIEYGPAHALQRRLGGTDGGKQPSLINKPSLTVRYASEPQGALPTLSTVPLIQIQRTNTIKESDQRRSTLATPLTNFDAAPSIKHTRRPVFRKFRSRSAERHEPSSSSHRQNVGLDLTPDPATSSANIDCGSIHIEPAPQRSHTFQTPTDKRAKFQWTHVPVSIPGLIPRIMASIVKDKSRENIQKKLLSESLWASHHNRSRHASSHARFIKPFYKLLMPKNALANDGIMSSHGLQENEPQLALFMPYLHWDTFQQLKARSSLIKRRWEMTSSLPVDPKVLNGRSTEHKLIWQFLSHNPSSIHCRRTLDQYGYPSLRDIEARDNDQVLYKKTRPSHSISFASSQSSSHDSDKKSRQRAIHTRKQTKLLDSGTACVLMVDQIWLWVLSNDTILTCFAPKEKGFSDNGSHMQADILTNIRKEINGDYALHVDDAFDFAAVAVSHCVRALLDNDDPMLQVFRVFEEYITEITEDHVKSFKQFRDEHRVEELSVRKGKTIPQFLDNSKDLNNLLELRDIEDELTTIKKLLEEQHRIVRDMLTSYQTLNAKTGRGRVGTGVLIELEDHLSEYQKEVATMLTAADITQDSYQNLLDMKQKQSNIVEAHLAREQAETAADQSRSVMIFTIITIIFLPLSFFSSVFGMNVVDWSGQATNPTLAYVIMIMACVSFAVIAVAILAAFNGVTRKILSKVFRLVRRLVRRPARAVLSSSRFDDISPTDSTSLSRQTTFDLEKGHASYGGGDRHQLPRPEHGPVTFGSVQWVRTKSSSWNPFRSFMSAGRHGRRVARYPSDASFLSASEQVKANNAHSHHGHYHHHHQQQQQQTPTQASAAIVHVKSGQRSGSVGTGRTKRASTASFVLGGLSKDDEHARAEAEGGRKRGRERERERSRSSSSTNGITDKEDRTDRTSKGEDQRP